MNDVSHSGAKQMLYPHTRTLSSLCLWVVCRLVRSGLDALGAGALLNSKMNTICQPLCHRLHRYALGLRVRHLSGFVVVLIC